MSVEILAHLSYAFAAMSFMLRDVFYLRCISILASGFMIASSFIPPNPWNANVLWNGLFILIHMYQISALVYGEKTSQFTPSELDLYETLFRGLTRLEFAKLLRAGRWNNAEPGHVLTKAGQPVRDLVLISHGAVQVEIGGKKIAELRDGQLVGEMSFVTGHPASATVVVKEPTQYLVWSQEDLRKLLLNNPTLHFALSHVLSSEITRKLMHTTKMSTDLSQPPPDGIS